MLGSPVSAAFIFPDQWVNGCSMAKRASFHPRRVSDIPAGPWVPHSAELISSPAWRSRSIHLVRLLDRIDCAHAGRENGYLTVTYQQFVQWGIGRRFIKVAIDDAVRLGLLVVEPGLYRGGARRQPSLYRLTYLKWKFVLAVGAPYFLEPTHDWRNFRPERVDRKSSRMVTRGEPSRATTCELEQSRDKRSAVTDLADLSAWRRK